MSLTYSYCVVPWVWVIRGLTLCCAHLRGRGVSFARISLLKFGRPVHGLEQTGLRLRALLASQGSLDAHVRPNLPQLLSLFLIILLVHRLCVLRALTHKWRDLEFLRKLMMLLALHLFDKAWILIVRVYVCVLWIVLFRFFDYWTHILLPTSTLLRDVLQAKLPRRLRKLRGCRPWRRVAEAILKKPVKGGGLGYNWKSRLQKLGLKALVLL